ncbi:GrpB family protein [Exiguobacterium sp. SL14]|nr:GrpB family protein [Exiguobacterium sp. SL14]MCY1691552.1 GrpB family protein [Exiguobacterium sp. SL14]
MRQVIVLSYQSEWESEYAREAERLRDVFGARLHSIHHMGSTSVPGLAKKNRSSISYLSLILLTESSSLTHQWKHSVTKRRASSGCRTSVLSKRWG